MLSSEIPTLSYTWSLKKVSLPDGAFPYKLLWGAPPGEGGLGGLQYKRESF